MTAAGILRLESYAELHVRHTVVVIGETSVVDKRIFSLYLYVLAKQIVDTSLVYGLGRRPFARRTIQVVASFHPELAFDDRCDASHIHSVGTIAKFFVDCAASTNSSLSLSTVLLSHDIKNTSFYCFFLSFILS